MAQRTPPEASRVPQSAVRVPRRITRRGRAVRREPPPLDLRTPSGRKTLPY